MVSLVVAKILVFSWFRGLGLEGAWLKFIPKVREMDLK